MDAKAKRLFTRALNKFFREASVDFEYALPGTKTEDPDWGDDTQSPLQWQKAHEPLTAAGNSINAFVANQIVQLPGGQAETYAFEWISRMDLPQKTAVRYRGQELEIERRSDNLEVVGAFLYFLKGRSDHHLPK